MSETDAPARAPTVRVLLLGALIAAGLLASQCVFVVRQGECAVRTTFGRVDGDAIADPGLYSRWPWPVQTIYRFDARTQLLEGGLEQTLTRDGRPVLMSVYAGWRISDPIRFLERVGSIEAAQRNLAGLIGHWRNATVGGAPFESLVNPDPSALKLEAIERAIADGAGGETPERFGIDIVSVGIRALSLPPAITEKVFERMRAERAAVAERYRSEGESEAVRIRAEADSLRDRKLAEAAADARRIRAEGDAAAAAAYSVFNQDPDLALFLRKLDVLEQTLSSRSTVILGVDAPPFDVLGGGAKPAEGAQP